MNRAERTRAPWRARAALAAVLAALMTWGAAWGKTPEGGALPKAAASPAAASFGFDAPLLQVDRFSDRAATHFRRSAMPSLPKPNEPILLDAPPFLVDLAGASGARAHCYDLDVQPARPARFYVFYDQAGNYILTQFPVVGVAPGDPGYSDLWDIWKVTVPNGFKADNSLRDLESVEKLLRDPKSGYQAERTGALLNGPIVPDGSSARHKAEGREGAATLRYAWYRGRRAPYLYFEQHLRWAEDQSPVSRMVLETLPTGGDPARLPLSRLGPLHPSELPGEKGYSPLRSLVGPTGKPLIDGFVNCPIVGD